ncbi:hypothetical protein TNCV_4631931 [Trichonephila clavipes]|nr:hypothetical protein TNCV_4631931 [Trichonephila clavipes]
MHVQMFWSSGQSDANPQCSVPKQAWSTHLRDERTESILPSPVFEPRTCGMEAKYTTTHSLDKDVFYTRGRQRGGPRENFAGPQKNVEYTHLPRYVMF